MAIIFGEMKLPFFLRDKRFSEKQQLLKNFDNSLPYKFEICDILIFSYKNGIS